MGKGTSMTDLKRLLRNAVFASAFAIGAAGASAASATTCVGTCGTLAPNGVVTAPPGGSNYDYVSTVNGVSGAGRINSVGGTNGSHFITDQFAAANGDTLSFYFNYVTSDGAGFSDYAFAELLDGSSNSLGYLFTGRTTTSGNTSPGFGLPSNISTLTPATSPIIPGGPVWSGLGGSSGSCYNAGCGYTGWIKSTYVLPTAGNFAVRYGVTNWGDTAYQSGLAYVGLQLNGGNVGGGTGLPTGAVPEPATWAMMLMGFFGLGSVVRRRRLSGLAA